MEARDPRWVSIEVSKVSQNFGRLLFDIFCSIFFITREKYEAGGDFTVPGFRKELLSAEKVKTARTSPERCFMFEWFQLSVHI